jgi:hypothetical protein
MKRFLGLLIVLLVTGSYAQDTIYFKSKEKQVIQLLEVNPDNIKYKRWDNQAGPTYTVLKSEVEQVALSNGKKEIISASPAVKPAATDTAAVKSNTSIAISSPEKTKPCDTLFFRSGKKQLVTIYDVTPAEIKYKPISNPDGPVYKVLKSEVKEIVFSTGMKQSFGDVLTPQYTSSSQNPATMALKGTRDATTFYKHRGGSIGTGITAFIFPLAGLIPAVICSNTAPKQHNLGFPDDHLWQNSDYRTAYTKEAYRIKKKRVWRGFGIGAAAGVLVALLLSQ